VTGSVAAVDASSAAGPSPSMRIWQVNELLSRLSLCRS
jgi:hypothetical protein